jgi:hypothetical protein
MGHVRNREGYEDIVGSQKQFEESSIIKEDTRGRSRWTSKTEVSSASTHETFVNVD